MDEVRARELLQAERSRVEDLLRGAEVTSRSDREEADVDAGASDSAELLADQASDDAVAEALRDRLAAVDRAEQRLEAGSYGRSVSSGLPISDARLEADPAAELTIEEAEQVDEHPR
jgi:DnaK suppressor protein